MKRRRKPVRKCYSCGLNLGERCAAFDIPHDMWRNGKCPGYQNEELLQQYMADQDRQHGHLAREKRKDLMKERRTEPHYQGVSPPGMGVH